MHTSIFLLLLTMSSCNLQAAQQEALPAVYVIEDVANDEGLVAVRRLVRISFDKDHRLTKEVLLTKDQRFFGHFGRHRIVADRYVATAYGGVIDLQTKKLIHDEQHGELLGSEDGRVVYVVANINRPSGFFAFDLKTQSVQRFGQPGHWGLPGVKSPDTKRSIQQQGGGGPIRLHYIDGTAETLAKEGFVVNYSPLSSTIGGGVPFLWLDNQRILTQRANGELATIDVNGKQEKVVEIKDEKRGTIGTPRLARDPQGRIVYWAHHRHVIDVKAKTATKMAMAALGNGFEVSTALDDKKVLTVFHEGKEIGRWNLHEYRTRTAPGLIAFPYAEPGQTLGYPKGVAVWEAKARRWQTVDLPVNDIIGWSK